ncbi:unnamed protein product, partial [Ectocarpus sp. 12 AP-2014]
HRFLPLLSRSCGRLSGTCCVLSTSWYCTHFARSRRTCRLALCINGCNFVSPPHVSRLQSERGTGVHTVHGHLSLCSGAQSAGVCCSYHTAAGYLPRINC